MRKRLDAAVDRAHANGVAPVFIHYPHPGNILTTWLGPASGDDERDPDLNILQCDFSVVFTRGCAEWIEADSAPSRPSRWATLLARIYEVFPLVCPTCQAPLTFIASLTDPEPVARILAHIGEPTSTPLIHPARGPPQTELGIRHRGGETHNEVAQDSSPDDLDQSSAFNPAEPEPIPDDDFDQSWGA